MNEIHSAVVPEAGAGYRRVDLFAAEACGGLSRSQLKERLVVLRINGRIAKLSARVAPGDRVDLELAPPPELAAGPEAVPLDILYEDRDVIVVNKPQGMVVHPAAGNYSGTLAQGLLHYCGAGSERLWEEESLRPGIVHRLDKDTSGVIITACHPRAQAFLAGQFKRKETRKSYLALVAGTPSPAAGRIESLLGRDPRNRKRFSWQVSQGKEAETLYRVLGSWNGRSLVWLSPLTGRTHQLRVHMLSKGTPICGDPLYGRGGKGFAEGLMLHAWRLSITLPSQEAPRTFTAPIPARFQRVLGGLTGEPFNDCSKLLPKNGG